VFSDLYGNSNSPHGRVVIDGGVTKFLKANECEGISRYASNLTIWLLGLDYKISHSLTDWPKQQFRDDKDMKKITISRELANLYYKTNHIILVIDQSQSMERREAAPSENSRISAVYSAVKELFEARLNSSTMQLDTISVVFFNNAAKIEVEREWLNEAFVDNFMKIPVTPSGRTDYSKAFDQVNKLLSRNDKKLQSHPPHMIFLSDGESDTSPTTSFNTLIRNHPTLEVEWVMYGDDTNGEKQLIGLSKIKGSFKKVLGTQSLKTFLVDFATKIL